MTRREKHWRRILSTSMLDATVPSDDVINKSDCENRANRKVKQNVGKRLGGSWVSHVPLQKTWHEKPKQVRRDDQSRYHNLKPPSSLGSGWNEIHCPPAKLEVLHLYRWFTHTRTCAAYSTKETPEHRSQRWHWRHPAARISEPSLLAGKWAGATVGSLQTRT